MWLNVLKLETEKQTVRKQIVESGARLYIKEKQVHTEGQINRKKWMQTANINISTTKKWVQMANINISTTTKWMPMRLATASDD